MCAGSHTDPAILDVPFESWLELPKIHLQQHTNEPIVRTDWNTCNKRIYLLLLWCQLLKKTLQFAPFEVCDKACDTQPNTYEHGQHTFWSLEQSSLCISHARLSTKSSFFTRSTLLTICGATLQRRIWNRKEMVELFDHMNIIHLCHLTIWRKATPSHLLIYSASLPFHRLNSKNI